MELRRLNFTGGVALEQRADDDQPRIVGVASVYYDGSERTEYELWKGMRERILKGAFDRAIKEDDVRALFNHDSNQVLGRTKSGTLSLQSRDEGLFYETKNSDTRVYTDVREMIRRGDVDGSSFAFRVLSERWKWDDARSLEIREIEEVQLYDVGPVTFPAYEATSAGVRAVGSIEEARMSYKRHLVQLGAIPRERMRLQLDLLDL